MKRISNQVLEGTCRQSARFGPTPEGAPVVQGWETPFRQVPHHHRWVRLDKRTQYRTLCA